MTNKSPDQRGLAHLALILVVLAVVGVIGFTGYKVLGGKDKDSSVAGTVTDKAIQEAAKAECDKINDDDLCKFYTKYKTHTNYRMVSKDSKGTESTIEIDGENSYMKMGGETQFEIISIGKTTYTKAGDTWYKKTEANPQAPKTDDFKVDLDEPAEETEKDVPEDKTVYKKIGKEACGNLQCFKYQIIDPEAQPTDKQFIWFDDKDYQMRRFTVESADGVNDTTFEYAGVTVKVPSPAKELGPNEYVMPGSNEVMTMPSYQ